MKRRVQIFALLILVTATVGFTAAAQVKPPKPEPEKWELASTSVDDESMTLFYFRKNSIVPIATNVYKFWIRTYEFEDKKWQPGYRMILFEADCKLRRSRIKDHTDYDDNDNVKKSGLSDAAAKWEEVQPDTAFEKLFDGICQRGALLDKPK